MAGPLRLYIDTQNRTLVKSNVDNTVISFPQLYQGETPTIQLFFLDPTGGTVTAPFSYVGLSATLKMAMVAGTPTGQSDTAIAFQDTWTAISGGYQAGLNLATVGISNSFTGSSQNLSCTTEIEVTETGGSPVKYWQGTNTLKAAVIDSQTTVPTPTASYPTRNEVVAGWVKKIGDSGDIIRIVSPNGSWAVDLQCDNAGSFVANKIQIS